MSEVSGGGEEVGLDARKRGREVEKTNG